MPELRYFLYTDTWELVECPQWVKYLCVHATKPLINRASPCYEVVAYYQLASQEAQAYHALSVWFSQQLYD